MAKRANPFLIDDENPALTAADFAAMRPASEAMPAIVFDGLNDQTKRKRGQRGPGRKAPLVPVTLNLDADVAAALKAGGKGWQGRLRTMVRTIVNGPETGASKPTKARPRLSDQPARRPRSAAARRRKSA